MLVVQEKKQCPSVWLVEVFRRFSDLCVLHTADVVFIAAC